MKRDRMEPTRRPFIADNRDVNDNSTKNEQDDVEIFQLRAANNWSQHQVYRGNEGDHWKDDWNLKN